MVNSSPIKTLSFILFFPFFVHAISTNEISTDTSFLQDTAFKIYCSANYLFGGITKNCFENTYDISLVENVIEEEVSNRFNNLDVPVNSENSVTVVERILQPQYIFTPGLRGEKGDPGTPGVTTVVNQQTVAQSPVQPTNLQAFGGITQPFWGGAGAGPVTNTTIIQGSSLPTGGLFNQVLTINASGTPEWITPVVGTSSSSFSLLAQNGLTLSTTSTSTLVELGGSLNKNTTINQGANIFSFLSNNGTRGASRVQSPGFIQETATSTNQNFYRRELEVQPSYTNLYEQMYSDQSDNQFYTSRYLDASGISETTEMYNGFGLGFQEKIVESANVYEDDVAKTWSMDWNSAGVGRVVTFGGSISTLTDANFRVLVNGSAGNTQLLLKNDGLYLGILNSDIATPLNSPATGYRFPLVRGASSTIITTNASGQLTFAPISSILPGGSISAAENGVTIGSGVIRLGGILTQPTQIQTAGFDFDIRKDVTFLTPNSTNNFESRLNRVFPLAPTLNLNYEAFTGFTAKTPTNSNDSRAGMFTVPNGSTIIGGGTESYFDAYNIKVGNDSNTYVNRINNASHGSVISNIVYGSSFTPVLRRTFFQTLDDGRANIRAQRPVVGSRSEMEFSPDARVFINASTATSSARLDLFSNLGLQFQSSLGANYFFPLTNGASGTVMTMGAGGQIAFNSIPSLIANAGNISIGTSSPLARLHIFEPSTNPVARFENTDGYCEIDPTTTSLICTSDKTLKKDITEIPNTLSLFSQLRPVTYHWNTQSDTDPFSYGLIAQEVEALYPTLVFTDPHTNIKTLSYGSLLPITIQAVKDLNTALGDITATSTTPESFSTSTIFKKILASLEWMGVKISNGLAEFKTVKTERLCISENGESFCITKDDLKALKGLIGNTEPEQKENLPSLGVSQIDESPEMNVSEQGDEEEVKEMQGSITPLPVENIQIQQIVPEVIDSIMTQ